MFRLAWAGEYLLPQLPEPFNALGDESEKVLMFEQVTQQKA
jgi:hypothetical protein